MSKKNYTLKENLGLGSLNGTADGTLAANFLGRDLQTKVSVDVDHQLNLAASLDALDGQLSNGLLGLPDELADLLLFLLIGVEVRVILILFGLGLLLLGLGLGLGNLDLTNTLANTDEDIAALLGDRELRSTTSGESSLGVQERLEVNGLARGELDTDGILKVRGSGNHGVDGLLDVLLVELLDQGGLDSGTSGSELGGVDGTNEGGGSEDGGLLGEDVAGQLGDLGGVGSTASEDNLQKLISGCEQDEQQRFRWNEPHQCPGHRDQPS